MLQERACRSKDYPPGAEDSRSRESQLPNPGAARVCIIPRGNFQQGGLGRHTGNCQYLDCHSKVLRYFSAFSHVTSTKRIYSNRKELLKTAWNDVFGIAGPDSFCLFALNLSTVTPVSTCGLQVAVCSFKSCWKLGNQLFCSSDNCRQRFEGDTEVLFNNV